MSNNRLEALQPFIQEGVGFIREGNFQRSITHFQNRDMARNIGFDLVVEEGYVVPRLGEQTYGEYEDSIWQNVSRSMFLPPELAIPREQGIILLRNLSDLSRLEWRGWQNDEDWWISYHEMPRGPEAAWNVAFCSAKAWLEGLYYIQSNQYPRTWEDLRDRGQYVRGYFEQNRARMPGISYERFGLWRPFEDKS